MPRDIPNYGRAHIARASADEIRSIARLLEIPNAEEKDDEELRDIVRAELHLRGKLQDGDGAAPRNILVRYGAHEAPMPIAGKTVGSIRSSLSAAWSIDPKAVARLDGLAVADADVVNEDHQSLEFIKPAGQKG